MAIGVLLINTGTPDAPTEEAIKPYLEQFLSDKELISCPDFIWKRVLKHAILPNRPARNVPRYERIWTDEGALFMLTSREQQRALQERAARAEKAGECEHMVVELAMRYGNPSIESGVERLKAEAVDTIVVVPLYPQYARVCAGTCFKEFDRILALTHASEWNPRVAYVRDYYDEPEYMRALEESVRAVWKPEEGARLAISFHSTPLRDKKKGDPYYEECSKTAQALAQRLQLSDGTWELVFQSRFGNSKWLSPFLSDVLQEWARAGVSDVCVVTPGFSVDNLETLVEVGEELRDEYSAVAEQRSRFTCVPALGACTGNIEAIYSAILKSLVQ